VISRDRATDYAAAAREAAPQALQVADRYHLVHNLADALELFLASSRTEIRRASQERLPEDEPRTLAAPVSLPPSAHVWRQQPTEDERNARITLIGRSGRIAIDSSPLYTRHLADADRDRPPCGHLHVSGSHLAAPQAGAPVHRREGAHQSIFDPYASYVLDRGPAGVHDGKQLYEEIRTLGFVFQSSPGAQLLAAPA
jgi:transposase